jgi:opacity protein-like surface antigen
MPLYLSVLAISRIVLLFLMLAISGQSLAQEPFFKPDSMRFTFYAGNFDQNPESQFIGARNTYGYGLNVSADLNAYPFLGLDFELLGTNQDYDTPVSDPFASLDNDTSVQTAGLLVGLRAFYPVNSKFRIYGVAGLGFYYVNMMVTGSVFGFPGTYEDEDRSTEFYYGAGASYLFDNWIVSIDYRKVNLEGSFAGFGISNADLGGEIMALGIGYQF